MNIWILNQYAIGPESIGGTRHYDLARELVKKGHHVKIFAASFNHLERKETISYESTKYKEQKFDGVEFIWLKTPPYKNNIQRIQNILWFSKRLNSVLNKYLRSEQPDVIIGSSVHPLTALIGLKKAQKNKVLFYFEERDLWPQTFIDFGMISEKNIVSKILFAIEKKLYKESDRVIFLFENAHKYAVKKGLKKEKHVYIPNGYSKDRIYESSISTKVDDLFIKLQDKKICMYIGSLGEANYMTPIINLANEMKNDNTFHFLIIGNGAKKNELVKYSNQLQLTNLTFFNPIPKKMIPKVLLKAHVGLISIKDSPLYKWGFSMNKIYDYLSVGLPIAMYSNIQISRDLNESRAIYNSDSTEDLREFIIKDSFVDRETIKQFAEENFSWEVLSQKLLFYLEKDVHEFKEKNNNLFNKVYRK
ncbi:glycosyltransferase family 4 protein [Solibacillus silvestris]